ncbi:MAG: hypothetical protein OEW39_06575 [Deltaproteobacteria bacterium]|nr:hypothetical protein [Deltaproteobacteria bacterium]
MQRKLAAILHADAVGYSRLVHESGEAVIHLLLECREIFGAAIGRHEGRLVNTPGDAILADFPSLVSAVLCAMDIQRDLLARNASQPVKDRLEFRIGITMGEVMIQGGDIFGDGVNIAARLEGLAPPGGICISGLAFKQVQDRVPFPFQYLGPKSVKNIREPVDAYLLHWAPSEDSLPIRWIRRWHWKTLSPARRWLMALALGLFLALAGTAAWQVSNRSAGDSQAFAPLTEHTLAILPFENKSGDPSQEALARGVAEDILSNVSRHPELFTLGRNSSFRYPATAVAAEVAKDLGVKYLLRGSLAQQAGVITISAALLDTVSLEPVWSQQYAKPEEELFSALDDISAQVLSRLSSDPGKIAALHAWRRGTSQVSAWRLYLQGLHRYRENSREHHLDARPWFEQSLQLNPGNPVALAALGWTYFEEAKLGWFTLTDEAMNQARRLAVEAVDKDPDSVEALLLHSWVSLYYHDFIQALSTSRKGHILAPNLPDMTLAYATILNYTGDPESARTLLPDVLRLNPLDTAYVWYQLGLSEFLTGRLEGALAAFKKSIGYQAHFPAAQLLLTATYAAKGNLKEAEYEGQEYHRSFPMLHPTQIINSSTEPFKDLATLRRLENLLNQAGIALTRSGG